MNFTKETYRIINGTLYEIIGSVILFFVDKVGNGYLDKYDVYDQNVLIETRKGESFCIHVYWIYTLRNEFPIAYYKIIEYERTQVGEKEKIFEAIKEGHYKSWRFIPDKK